MRPRTPVPYTLWLEENLHKNRTFQTRHVIAKQIFAMNIDSDNDNNNFADNTKPEKHNPKFPNEIWLTVSKLLLLYYN